MSDPGSEPTPYAETGELTNVKALAREQQRSGSLAVTVDGNALTVGYAELAQRSEALKLGNKFAARIGARLHADVVWKPITHRDHARSLTAGYADVQVRFGLVAPISADLVSESLRHLRCLESIPALSAADHDLAAFRKTRAPGQLRSAFERIRELAEKLLGDSPLVADGAIGDLWRAVKQHHHGFIDPPKLKDQSLIALETCYEKTQALQDALIAKLCG